jgi:multicomponent Na+:H+ antiporter subunit G
VSVREAIVVVLVVAGVALEVLAGAGVVMMRDAYDRLHYTGAASLGLVLVAAGVLVQESLSLIGWRALLIAAFTLVSSPVLVHVTARAIVLRERRR